MARYHLYYLDRGMVVGASDIEAVDDSDAACIARREGRGRTVEIWNDHQRLRVVTPDLLETF